MNARSRLWRGMHRTAAALLAAALVAMSGASALAASPSNPGAPADGQGAPFVPAVAVSTASLPIAAVGSAYTATLQAAGGIGPYTWNLVSGTIPGMTLSAGGVLSGSPSAAGSFPFEVQVTAAGPTPPYPGPEHPLFPLPGWLHQFLDDLLPAPPALNVAVSDLTLTVDPAVQVATTPLPAGQVGSPYVDLLTASGGTGSDAFVWSVVYGSPPAGLTLSSTGLIDGTPTAAGSSTFTVTAADVTTPSYTTSAQFTLAIEPQLLQIQTVILPDGQQGSGYDASLQATGGTAPYTWSFTPSQAGTLGWLTLNPQTGVFSGTPGASDVGTFGLNVTVTDSGSTAAGAVPAQQSATLPLTITVSPTSTVTVVTSSLPAGQIGQPYPATYLQASGGTGPYRWSWTAAAGSSVPTGLTLGANGFITGTPTGPNGSYSVVVTAQDSSPTPNVGSKTLSLTIGNAVVTVTTTSLPDGQVGKAYLTSGNQSVALQASGGTQPYTWSLSCSAGTNGQCLPGGLSLDASTGVISGTPTAATSQPLTFTAKVTDSSNPAETATQSLSITIHPTGLIFAQGVLPNAAVGDAYETANGGAVSLASLVSGGQSPYSFQLPACTTQSCPALPQGLTLEGNGTITGTPAAAAQGTDTFTVEVSDHLGDSATQSFTLTVNGPLKVTTTSLPAATQGASYSATLGGSGGVTPYSWAVTSGSLPSGLSLNASSGAISGTVSKSAATGTDTFTVTATDHENVSSSAQLSIQVNK